MIEQCDAILKHIVFEAVLIGLVIFMVVNRIIYVRSMLNQIEEVRSIIRAYCADVEQATDVIDKQARVIAHVFYRNAQQK